jgi:lipopolysaccharide/colanic/teichoic acid biosynthesis glycosyltransferase
MSRKQNVQQDLEQSISSSLPSKANISLFYLCWYKFIDIIFGIGGMVILLLLLPILALLIYANSPGPIFYCQERLGYRGKIFRMYKFRSMYRDAEPGGHPIWAAEDDRRVTRIGRFMRAIHLDELPQVINILRGEMSLIGPRPEREELFCLLEKTIPLYRSRLAVKPGLTGWAQVNYHYARSEEDTLIKLHYDLYYIKHRSFKLDIVILSKTVVEVVSYRGT